MDHTWAHAKLMNFAVACRGIIDSETDSAAERNWEDSALALEPVVQRLMNAYEPGLGDYQVGSNSQSIRWGWPRELALRAAGLAKDYAALQRSLKPDAPYIAADGLHKWVWDAARPMLEADARQEAVNTAARAVNARIQQKTGRTDIGEYELVMQVLDTQEPKVGKPRLRLPGDRSSPTWKSQQEGVKFFAAGCFRAIRNPGAHEDSLDWSEQEALEYLSALSALARWVESSTVEY
jgi:uncharacterized protein (TIGR02391 family)